MLAKVAKEGWPHHRRTSPLEIRQYWGLRDEIAAAEGLLFLGERLIIPSSLRQEMLRRIHEGHLGIEKCKAHARAVMYWPGMAEDIENIVATCDTCLKFRRNNQKEPLMPHPVPQSPWQTVGADITTYRGQDFLVLVDYYSKYPEMALLKNKTAEIIIQQMKSVFAHHGIPGRLVCDNMPFASRQFHSFAADWDIAVKTASPEFPRANGQSERMIQTIKQMRRKAHEDNRDPYIALLQYPNTSVSGLSYSPAQLLMSRRL